MTPAALGKTLNFWDMGLSLNYAESWAAPQFSAAQVVIGTARPLFDSQKRLLHPSIALTIIDPARQFGLTADTALPQIALAALQQKVDVAAQGQSKVAALDAGFVQATETSTNTFVSSIAFRLPDGRVGLLTGLAPVDQWADFAPTFEQVRASAQLLKAANYPVPTLTTVLTRYDPGGLLFNAPDGWTSHTTASGLVLADPAVDQYIDGTGFANGPQLSLLTQAVPTTSGDLHVQFASLIGATGSDPLQDVNIGGNPGVMTTSQAPLINQTVTLVGVWSTDRKVITIFRWTAPLILSDSLRPVFLKILGTVRYGPRSGS
jgi:hypothetical protein